MLSRSLEFLRDDKVPMTSGRYLLTRQGVLTDTSDGSLVPLEYSENGEPIVAKFIGLTTGAISFHMKNNKREKKVRNFRIFYPDFEKLSLSLLAATQDKNLL